jgi:hypothetical protein
MQVPSGAPAGGRIDRAQVELEIRSGVAEGTLSRSSTGTLGRDREPIPVPAGTDTVETVARPGADPGRRASDRDAGK